MYTLGMKIDAEKMLLKIRKLEASVKRLNKQGVRCGRCVYLDSCAKNPTTKDEICICFLCEVVQP